MLTLCECPKQCLSNSHSLRLQDPHLPITLSSVRGFLVSLPPAPLLKTFALVVLWQLVVACSPQPGLDMTKGVVSS